MQFSFDEIKLMLDENRQEAMDATPSPLAGRPLIGRAEILESFRIQVAWRKKCELIAVHKTKLRVSDSDWANYRDQLSRRQQRKGAFGSGENGRSNPAKAPSWDLLKDDEPKLPRSIRRAKAREAAVEERLAAPPNPFD